MENKHPTRTRSSWGGKLLWSGAVICAFIGGWFVANKVSAARAKDALPPETGLSARDPDEVMVTVEPVSHRPVARAVEGLGTLHGYEEVTISAKVGGRVNRVRFDVSNRVKSADVLLEIDPTDYELAVQQAERTLNVELAKLGLTQMPTGDVNLSKVPTVMVAQTRLENAQARYDRARQLAATKAISTDELDTVSSEYRAAHAEHANQLLVAKSGWAMVEMRQTALAIARQQLKDTQVRVPTPSLPVPGAADTSYVVTHRTVAEGTLVQPGTEICKLVINQTLKARVPVPERYSPDIRQGQKAEVRTAASPRPFTGTITRVNVAVEPATRTFEVEVQIPNPGGELKPGSFAKVAVHTGTTEDAATVPLSALVNFVGVNKIFLLENGRAREVQVTSGVQTTEWVEIVQPTLPRDALVITSGHANLATDSPVAVRRSPGSKK